MRTFIIKSAAAGITVGETYSYDPLTGKQYLTHKGPLSAADIQNFKYDLPNQKQKLYAAIKPMLAKGGFYFDPSLWQWSFSQPSPYTFTLWVTITFVDDTGGGKALFMQDLKNTGIMNYDFEIIKPYG